MIYIPTCISVSRVGRYVAKNVCVCEYMHASVPAAFLYTSTALKPVVSGWCGDIRGWHGNETSYTV